MVIKMSWKDKILEFFGKKHYDETTKKVEEGLDELEREIQTTIA